MYARYPLKKKFRSYQEKLLEDLRDPELTHHYLNETLADEDPRMALLALKSVRKAQCSKDHTPNAVTKKALENVRAKKGLQRADTVEELFKKLNQ